MIDSVRWDFRTRSYICGACQARSGENEFVEHYEGCAFAMWQKITETLSLDTRFIDETQKVLTNWARECFGEEQVESHKVRALRLLEEAIEFAQACEVTMFDVERLMHHVYSQPADDATLELAQVGVTAVVAASSFGVQFSQILARERDRVLSKSRAHYTERNAKKDALGFDGGLRVTEARSDEEFVKSVEPTASEEGMTPELEAKAREWTREEMSDRCPECDSAEFVSAGPTRYCCLRCTLLTKIEALTSQLSAERKWWIARIEQERDKWTDADKPRTQSWFALNDLLTSVRERGGK